MKTLLSSSSGLTDANGQASTLLTLANKMGRYQVIATATSLAGPPIDTIMNYSPALLNGGFEIPVLNGWDWMTTETSTFVEDARTPHSGSYIVPKSLLTRLIVIANSFTAPAPQLEKITLTHSGRGLLLVQRPISRWVQRMTIILVFSISRVHTLSLAAH